MVKGIPDKPKSRFITPYIGKNLSPQEKYGVDRLLNMMMVAKQQIMLRKALHNE